MYLVKITPWQAFLWSVNNYWTGQEEPGCMESGVHFCVLFALTLRQLNPWVCGWKERLKGCTEEWIDGSRTGRMDGRIGWWNEEILVGRRNGWMDRGFRWWMYGQEWIDGWIDGGMNRWTNGWVCGQRGRNENKIHWGVGMNTWP
jgi:hypothetical protein